MVRTVRVRDVSGVLLSLAVFLACREHDDRLSSRSGSAASATLRPAAIDTGSVCIPDSATARAASIATGPWLFSGASWRCALDTRRVVRVVAQVDPDTQEVVQLRALRLLREPDGVLLQTLDVGLTLFSFRSDDLRAIDLDGDGQRDLQLQYALPRGSNTGSVVWLLSPATNGFVFDSTLSHLTNLEPVANHCVTSSALTGPGADDTESSDYCLESSKWIEISRTTRILDERAGFAVERRYTRQHGELVLVRTDTTRFEKR